MLETVSEIAVSGQTGVWVLYQADEITGVIVG